MYTTKSNIHLRRGFTIIELVVVVAIIAILATISIVGYGAWRTSTITTQVKNDLNVTAAAMENAKTFNNGYPTTLPNNITPSDSVTLTLQAGSSATAYCVDGVSSESPTNTYYVASESKDQGALEGTCATRPGQVVPAVPTMLAAATVASTSISLTWLAGSGGGTASSYTAQCASEPSFVANVGTASVSATYGTVTGLAAISTQYCRVNASNAAGTSAWSSVLTVGTDDYQAPTGLAVTTSTGTSLTLGWTANADAVTYTVQCALNAGFTTGLLSFVITAPTVTGQFNDLNVNTAYYCRINAVNPNGTSPWSSTLTTATNNYYGSLAVATSIEGYWTTAPTGFLLEDGSAVSRTLYASLFAVIGTTYGAGDGSTTFNLPDSRGRTPVNQSTDVEFTTIGQLTGSKTETLTTIPSHSHAQITTANTGGTAIRRDYNADAAGGVYPQGINTGGAGGGGAHNNIQPSIVKTFAIKYAPIDSSAPTLPAGTSISGYWASIPTGYLAEDGAAVSRTTYASLFSVVGTTHGAGDGSTTFNTPDSRGRASVNINSSDTEFDIMGEKYGEKAHTLTLAEIPAHTHAQYVTANSGGSAVRNDYDSDGPGGVYPQGINTGAAGSGGSHNEIQPSITRKYAIKHAAAAGSGLVVETGTSTSGYWTSAPTGFLVENGAAVSRTTYADLFGVIGTTYGAGNGTTTFNVPNSQGRLSVNLKSTDTEFNTMGELFGTKTHTLTIGEIPSHSHAQYVTALSGGSAIRNDYNADAAGGTYDQGQQTGSAGGGGAHNNIQPSIVKLFVIKY